MVRIKHALYGSPGWKDYWEALDNMVVSTVAAAVGAALCPESAGVTCVAAAGAIAGIAGQCMDDCDDTQAVALAAVLGAATAGENPAMRITPGKNFKSHFLNHKTLLQGVTGDRYSTLAKGGPMFLDDLSMMVESGDLAFVGWGTLKQGQPAGKVYRGQRLTLVTTADNQFWTLLKTGEGLDKAVVMVPGPTG